MKEEEGCRSHNHFCKSHPRAVHRHLKFPGVHVANVVSCHKLYENLCCGRSTCITTYEIFYTMCLHPVNLRIALENNYRADEVLCSNRNLRRMAYRQFILWAHGKLGKHNRRVVPSCVVQAICHHYPSPTGLYMGYREH